MSKLVGTCDLVTYDVQNICSHACSFLSISKSLRITFTGANKSCTLASGCKVQLVEGAGAPSLSSLDIQRYSVNYMAFTL